MASKTIPAIEVLKAKADPRAAQHRALASTLEQAAMPVPTRFFRRMAGLRGADLRN